MALLANGLLYLAAATLWLRHLRLTFDARLKRSARRARRFASTQLRLGFARPPSPHPWHRGGRNRTAPEVEASVCRLHVERPDLGLRGLRLLMARTEAVALSPSTVRAILLRSEVLDERPHRARISDLQGGGSPLARVFVSKCHLRSFCADFLEYHNRCRCHSSYWGFTPDEVFSETPATAPLGELLLFDGQLLAHRFT